MLQQIILPEELKDKLSADHKLEALVTHALSVFEPVLQVNSAVFFPEYTDHGLQHVQATLNTAWNIATQRARKHLTSQDAACLICGTLLHDAAMHLGREGFVRLVTDQTSLRPIRWFSSRLNEAMWPATWSDFRQEASRFSGRDNIRLFGSPEVVRPPSLNEESPSLEWTGAQHRLIGEFVRRHHGRLAHEIALAGIPGPTAEQALIDLAAPDWFRDMCGLIARSHATDLRLAVDYLAQSPLHFNDPANPHYVHAPYLMALLRISDYVQVQSDRAPVEQLVFVQKLTSPLSKREWATHIAVEQVQFSGSDAEAIDIRAMPHSVDTFLKLKSLLRGLQDELDRSWAVLGEVYSRRSEYELLGLTIRRVRSNLDDQGAFAALTRYVPQHAAFASADSDLLKLLVCPLYGDSPYVGVRELMQNAVDAVRERKDLAAAAASMTGTSLDSGDGESVDVEVEIKKNAAGSYLLVIRDYGVGMTPETICRYFLRAGASFRSSDAWRRQHADAEGASRVARSGRFGVGVLAAFLLGSRITVRTRHAVHGKACEFSADIDTDPIEIRYFDETSFSPGTEIEIHLYDKAAERLTTLTEAWDWYVLPSPRVRRRVNGKVLPQALRLPDENSPSDGTWRRISSHGYGPIFWSYEKRPGLACNGIHVIADRARLVTDNSVKVNHPILEISQPSLSVFDPDGRLPLSLLRNELVGQPTFSRDLFESVWMYHIEQIAARIAGWHNGAPALDSKQFWESNKHLSAAGFQSPWCLTSGGIIPLDVDILRSTKIRRVVFGPLSLVKYLSDLRRYPGTAIVFTDTARLSSDDINEWAADLCNGIFYGRFRADHVPFLRAQAVRLGPLNGGSAHERGSFGAEYPIVAIAKARSFLPPIKQSEDQATHALRASWVGEMMIEASEVTPPAAMLGSIWQQIVDQAVPTDRAAFQHWLTTTTPVLRKSLAHLRL